MVSTSVETRAGAVAGTPSDGVIHWLGIPYARAERFAAPKPMPQWDGVRAAHAFAPRCPQLFFGTAAARAKVRAPQFDENCLALNIWAPAREAAELRPVFVWIHGGAFLGGCSDSYDGAELAALGDMLVVTINYRLGVLGFVNFAEALDVSEIPSNLGLRDQIAALEWVRYNIEAFGGDPARITVGGESAGSLAVSLLMLSPVAWPLFHGAVLQSGAISLIHGRDDSIRIAHRYLDLLDLRGGSLGALQALDLGRLFEAQAAIDAEERGGLPAGPWFDDALLPKSLEAARVSPTAPVPLLAGSNRDEIRLFEILPGNILPMRWPNLERLVRDQLPAEPANRLMAAYPRTRRGRRALASDLTFAMPTRHFAERHSARNPTWVYRFDYSHLLLGACHALALPFLWPFRGVLGFVIRGGPMSGLRAGLAHRIKKHWAHFVRHGRPGDDWPPFTPGARKVHLFNLRDTTVEDPESVRYAAWGGQDIAPRQGSAAANHRAATATDTP
ncbi:MAG: alpha/beta hydrolase fold family protein [Bradyrhizobium sp.]|nr:alpha/beta hydrolase fold family protein [Bradyrhizobium sp.]